MRNIILPFFLVLSNIVCAQTIRGIYTKQALASVGDRNDELPENMKAINIYEYVYSGGRSVQNLVTPGGTKIDTIISNNEEYNVKVQSTLKTSSLSKSIIVKDFRKNKIERNFKSDGKETLIIDELPVYKWIITNETKLIEGYLCKKATTEIINLGYLMPTTAWFCEDIPINDGPVFLHGLPGLILEASSGNIFIFKFKNFSLSANKNTKIESIQSDLMPKTNKEFENENAKK